MNKSKLLAILLSLFWVHATSATAMNSGTFPLSPSQKVSPTETNQNVPFLQKFNVLAFALGLYHLDVKERLSKEGIRDRLPDASSALDKRLGVSFDIENMHFNRKGFTRYYPFSIEGRQFIIRIFDVGEKHYLPELDVYFEGVFEASGIGFQVIPGIDQILEDKKIEKMTFRLPAGCATHP